MSEPQSPPVAGPERPPLGESLRLVATLAVAGLLSGFAIVSAYRPAQGRLGHRIKIAAHDPQRWKDVAYLGLHGVLGFCAGLIWLVLVAVVLGGI